MRKLLCLLVLLCLTSGVALASPLDGVFVRFDGAEAVTELAPNGKLNYRAGNAIDGKLDTCWAYTRSETPGATISFYVDEPVVVSGLCIMPGYAKSDALWLSNNRVKRFELTLSDGCELEVELEETSDQSWAVLEFEEMHEIEWVRLQVLEVYRGSKYDDTCISEIKFF